MEFEKHNKFLLDDKFYSFINFDNNIICKAKAIYEVIRVINGHPLFIDDHIFRLRKSAKLSNFKIWYNNDEIKNKISLLIKENKIYNGNIKFAFVVDNDNPNNKRFVAMHLKAYYPSKEDYKNGVPAIIYTAERKSPKIKQVNIDLRRKVNNEIKKQKVFEAILVNKEGYITEGSRSNIFFISNNKVYTPSGDNILLGITRQYIIEICKNFNIKLIEKKIHSNDIGNYQSAFITGTSPKVLPISRIDSFNYEIKNTLLRKIMRYYDKSIENFLAIKRNI